MVFAARNQHRSQIGDNSQRLSTTIVSIIIISTTTTTTTIQIGVIKRNLISMISMVSTVKDDA